MRVFQKNQSTDGIPEGVANEQISFSGVSFLNIHT